MARHNVGEAAHLCRADALRPVTRDAVVLVDPARRGGGRRRFRPDDYTPAAGRADRHLPRPRPRRKVRSRNRFRRSAAARFRRRGRGDVAIAARCGKRACGRPGWPSGACAGGPASWRPRRAGHRRRARTTARCGRPGGGSSTPTARWCAPGWCATTAPGTGCGNSTPTSPTCRGIELPPAVRGFEVLEQLAFDERRLRQALSALDCGALEILVRGVRVDPDALRRRMRLRGSRPLSVVITRIGRGPPGARRRSFAARRGERRVRWRRSLFQAPAPL